MTITKITYEELENKLMDPKLPDSELRQYLMPVRRAGSAFEIEVLPNLAVVQMERRDLFRVASVSRPLGWGNAMSRWRRHQAYALGRVTTPEKPVLVSEGDSWFQFPFLIDDVIDHLGKHYLIWSLDAAGDTADNMVFARPEYMQGLRERKEDGVAAFLFSGAGNDILGENALGVPVLGTFLKPFEPGNNAAAHVDESRFQATLGHLEECYRKVISNVRSEYPYLPILIHGYDYALPYGEPADRRHPLYVAKDEWLGRPMTEKGIEDQALRRDIVRFLVDGLYAMLYRVAGDSSSTCVHVVDVRGTLTNVSEWVDEIHGTSEGFGKVADRFRATLRAANVPG